MLNGKKFTITGKSIVNKVAEETIVNENGEQTVVKKTVQVEIASFGAILDVETGDLSFYNRQVDKEACKENREEVRADQAEFEDFAYAIQETVKSMSAEASTDETEAAE